MSKAKVKPNPHERLQELFLGATVTAITIDENSFDLASDRGTLHLTPTRFEALGATTGVKITEQVTEAVAIEFMAGKTISRTTHEAGHTTLFFTNDEAIVIAGEPNVETDIRNTYTITKVVEEELL